MRAIDADKLAGKATYMYGFGENKYVPEKAIKAAPTITYEDLVPHGRWEMRGGKLYCTHCGERACVTRDREDFWYTAGTDYCPNCGAKMDGQK